jgi:hypothetical protein
MKRYGALRFVSSFYKMLGGIMILVSLFVLVFAQENTIRYLLQLQRAGAPVSLEMWVSSVLVAALPFLGLCILGIFVFGFGQFFSVMMDIEENTRYLRAIYRKDKPLPEWRKPLNGMWDEPEQAVYRSERRS